MVVELRLLLLGECTTAINFACDFVKPSHVHKHATLAIVEEGRFLQLPTQSLPLLDNGRGITSRQEESLHLDKVAGQLLSLRHFSAESTLDATYTTLLDSLVVECTKELWVLALEYHVEQVAAECLGYPWTFQLAHKLVVNLNTHADIVATDEKCPTIPAHYIVVFHIVNVVFLRIFAGPIFLQVLGSGLVAHYFDAKCLDVLDDPVGRAACIVAGNVEILEEDEIFFPQPVEMILEEIEYLVEFHIRATNFISLFVILSLGSIWVSLR